MEEYGYEIGREYITDILMREEEHWLDGFLKDINIPDKIDQVPVLACEGLRVCTVFALCM